MPRVLGAFVVLLAALGVSGTAQAVGLGNIEVESRLNQRLNAKIALVGLKEGELADLQVGLADDKAFSRQGIERDAIHLSLTFKLVETGVTTGYVMVSSKQTIREPSLEFVVELSSFNGRSLRSYALLLETR